MDVQYPLYPGKNYLGRTDDKPVDIDLDDQEAPDRIWCSRQHAVITFENGRLTIEDLNSLNGTFVNRTRVHPGQVRDLHENDVIQVGTVHMKVTGEQVRSVGHQSRSLRRSLPDARARIDVPSLARRANCVLLDETAQPLHLSCPRSSPAPRAVST